MSFISQIKGIVNTLVNTYHTRDPFIIAEEKEINVFFMSNEHFSAKGTFIRTSSANLILIKKNLTEADKRFVVAHELGHIFLHPELDFYFISEYTYFPISRFELEANVFATELLIEDNNILEYKNENYSFEAISKILDVPQFAVELKYRILIDEL
jgi:Zn-dependent peptidase ImmA (M78 family)